MATFVFTAKNRDTGDDVQAEVQAENEQAAAQILIGRNLFPVSIEAKDQPKAAGYQLPFLKNRVSAKEKILFTRQLSTLINAGLPILQSLRSVQEQLSSVGMKQAVGQVITDVEGGSSLSASMAKFPKIFNQTYLSVITAGETSGSLDKAMQRLAHQMEKDAQIFSKVRSALVYPAIVVFVVIAVLIFMLLVVLPQVGQMYKDFHKQLPYMTRLLLSLSNLVGHFWWIFIILIGGGYYGLQSYVKTTAGRRQFDRLKLKIPLFGVLLKKVYMARFARSMATLLSSGVPVLNALSTTRNSVNNEIIAEEIDVTSEEVRGGKPLSASLREKPEFLKIVPQMIKIGEDSGSIDATLDRLAIYFEDEIDEAVKNISTSIEPILMIVLGVVVGGILIAVLLPIYGLVGQGLS